MLDDEINGVDLSPQRSSFVVRYDYDGAVWPDIANAPNRRDAEAGLRDRIGRGDRQVSSFEVERWAVRKGRGLWHFGHVGRLVWKERDVTRERLD